MPKRKRASTTDSRANKRRRKNCRNVENDEANETDIKLPQRGKRQIVPKSALKHLKKAQDHLLFFKLLSQTKRPCCKFEWDLMAQTFIQNGSINVNGQILYNFYSILAQNASIHDPVFSNNDTYKSTIFHRIDFSSDEYKKAYQKFMNKLIEFNENQINYKNICILDKKIDLFYLYILVTKHGGFNELNSINKWIDILYGITLHFNPHSKYYVINELQLIYKKYLYKYQQIFYHQILDDDDDDDFGDDLYLEQDPQISNIITKYPLQRNKNNNNYCHSHSHSPHSYWMQTMQNGNNLQLFMFGHPIKSKHKHNTNSNNIDIDIDIDNRNIESILKSILKPMICINIDNDNNYSDDFYICPIKGMHPYTRKLIHFMLFEQCESEISLNEIENQDQDQNKDKEKEKEKEKETETNNNNRKNKIKNKNNNLNRYKLRECEINYIIQELIIKILRLMCVSNDGETSMIMAFLVSLNLLKTQFNKNENGYCIYNGYYIYYKRIMTSYDKFVCNAMKMPHNFLSHPKGRGLVMIWHNPIKRSLIKRDTFLYKVSSDIYSCSQWIEYSFCSENLRHKLQSAYLMDKKRISLIFDYIDDKKRYHVLSIHLVNDAMATMINHSCSPNCVIKPYINNKSNEFELGLFAINDIVGGDELTIDYKWHSFCNDICLESICLCGLSACNGTYIKYKDIEIENDYLSSNHKYVERFVKLLNCTTNKLTEIEKKELDKLHISYDDGFGDWMYKYLAYLVAFIVEENENLSLLLYKKVNIGNDDYSLSDARNDANDILLRRMRSLSICVERIKYFLASQEILFNNILINWQHSQIPKYIKLFGSLSSNNTLFIPPIRFAEIDEIIDALWNNEDSLINRLLNALNVSGLDGELYAIILDIVSTSGLMQESQYGLYLIRCKFVCIAQLLSKMKCTKINRHLAAADILYLYANTYRFVKSSAHYLSFASCWNNIGIINNYRPNVIIDNRYLTRSVRNETIQDEIYEIDNDNDSEEERFIYSSSFALISLLGWYHHCNSNDISNGLNGEEINRYLYKEYYDNIYGTILLPDIESCYSANCKGLYMATHRNYLFKCLLQAKNWMNSSYTKQYECTVNTNNISSCPVPQFTFQNKIGLFGSPVLDSYFDGFDNQNNKYIKQIVNGLQNDYCFKPRK